MIVFNTITVTVTVTVTVTNDDQNPTKPLDQQSFVNFITSPYVDPYNGLTAEMAYALCCFCLSCFVVFSLAFLKKEAQDTSSAAPRQCVGCGDFFHDADDLGTKTRVDSTFAISVTSSQRD